MSVDTIERVNEYFKAAVADVLPVFTIYKNVNENLPESSSGPMVKLWVEPDFDSLLTDADQYQEHGIVIAQVFIEEGESSLLLHSIMDSIKVAFRSKKLVDPSSDIFFYDDIEFSNGGTVPREQGNRGRGSTREWRKWDMFIPYSKYQCD
jgi:hypothetical protein